MKRRAAKEVTASHVVAERDDAECTGFFDRTKDQDRRCVVLAVSETRPRMVGVEEFVAPTADQLVALASVEGWELGSTEEVEERCRPVWTKTAR